MDEGARQSGLDVLEWFVHVLGFPVDHMLGRGAGHQSDQRVERLGREHRVGVDVGVRQLRVGLQLQQRRYRHHRRRRLALGLQPLRERQCQVAAGGIAGQHDLIRLVPAQPQPLVSVVAVVQRHADGVLGDEPVVDHQHR